MYSHQDSHDIRRLFRLSKTRGLCNPFCSCVKRRKGAGRCGLLKKVRFLQTVQGYHLGWFNDIDYFAVYEIQPREETAAANLLLKVISLILITPSILSVIVGAVGTFCAFSTRSYLGM